MKKIRTSIILLAMLLLFSSCAGQAQSVPRAETLKKDEEPELTFGLLDPNAEVRGMWIATVGNINYPSKKGLDASALAAELEDIVETCAELGLNTLFFQVRPCADALYDSSLFPFSEFVSGEQGRAADKGFDPLAYLIKKAGEYKISVHAWVNPLRVTYGSAKYPKTDVNALSEDHIARQNPEWVIAYDDGKLYFDAGNPSVREYIAAGVREIVENYAVDGVVFDDYFYPYPVKNDNGYAPFDDSRSYSEYGGGSELDDWRRDNINRLVKSCYDAVKSANSECEFGISPFGIWQNDDGENGGSESSGLEAYESLYCDALAWVELGCVDYIAPQLYWRFDTSAAPYDALAEWWNNALSGTGVKLLISHAAYMYDEDGWTSPSGELERQVEYARELISYRGSVLYGYSAVKKNAENICDEIERLFEYEIIYSDLVSDGRELDLDLPSETELPSIVVRGSSDPAKTLYFGDKKISVARDGSFELDVALEDGVNTLIFICGDKRYSFEITKTTQK